VWELRGDLGVDPITGKRKQFSETFHGPARAADQRLRDLIDQQAPSRSDGVGVTVGQLLDQWLEECDRMDLSPSTLRTYRSQIEHTIRPCLGKVTLTRLTAKNLDSLYGAMKDAGKSPKTIRNHHAIISAALHQAVRWGWVRSNVAEMAKPPRVSQKRVEAPSLDVVRDVIEAAERRDPRLAPLLMLAALTGMRRGELCALRWSDVDLDAGMLTVNHSVVVAPKGLVEKSTKSNRERVVALDAVALALLEQHRSRAAQWVRQAGGELSARAFVFSPYVEGTKPFRPDNVTSFFIRVRNEVGAPTVRLHDLRHFTATQLIGAGVDVRTVAGRLGHSDPSVTLRVYSHALQEREKAAADIMGSILTRATDESQEPRLEA
jgi:integrase